MNDESPETPQPPAARNPWWLIAIGAVVALAVGIGIGYLIGNANSGNSETASTATTATTTTTNGTATPQQIATAQKALTDVGCYTGPIDGVYGPVTDAAIRSFQQAKGLTVDGVVGPQTLAALQEAQTAGKPVCTPRDNDIGSNIHVYHWHQRPLNDRVDLHVDHLTCRIDHLDDLRPKNGHRRQRAAPCGSGL